MLKEKWKYRFTSRSCILWGVFLVLCSGMRVPSGSSRIPLSISLMCVQLSSTSVRVQSIVCPVLSGWKILEDIFFSASLMHNLN